MANLAAALKDVVRRLARKEVKEATGRTKHAVAQYRRDIARLKRVLVEQQKKLSFLEGQQRKQAGQPQAAADPLEGSRFSARSVRAQRRRLKLSAREFGHLVGVSGLAVYNWENGKARPRKAQFATLVGLRGIGRREALRRLEAIEAERAKRKARGRKKPR